MANEIPFRKIYIDSRYATKDSVSSSNFKGELPITAQMPDNTVFYVCDVCIPHAWKTIEEDIHDKLCLYVTKLQGGARVRQSHIIVLAPGNYTPTTFTAELITRLNEEVPDTFYVLLGSDNDVTIGISNTTANNNADTKFRILSDEEITKDAYFASRGISGTCNDVINNEDKFSSGSGDYKAYSSGFLSLNWISNIYISSPDLGSFDTIFAGRGRGENNIVKKVPVSAGYGFQIVDSFITTNEFLDCSRQTIQTIEIHLKTGKGIYVPLNGSHVSMSLVFNRLNPNL
jgi:hypothetical protein